MPDLIIGIGKGKPVGSSKDDPMGEPPDDSTKKEPSADMDAFDSALDDAFDAVSRKDKDGFKDAMGAAISAKCSEMYGSEETSEDADKEKAA